ncbi:hypothetical protein PSE10B_07050 [Pseudomonas amygdali pv. eriobotryae]|nr:hypothetical protein PSE10B_07050 [Pseudomonas amygdali pv. eriobotryae]
MGNDLCRGLCTQGQHALDLLGVNLPGDRQMNALVLATKQRAAEKFLQLRDLTADRALGG